MHRSKTRHYLLLALLALPACLLSVFSAAADMSENEDFVWQNGLRQSHYGDREIIESEEIIALVVPRRAEDAALVPVKINARIAQTESRYIKTVALFIDNNPGPLAGRFHFTPHSGKADLALRVRVNAYTPIRAIAEMNDGRLYMTRRFVKASGGCSAPASSDLSAAMSRMGKMKFRTRDAVLNEPTLAQLNISHPNVTGLQMDQISRLYIPAHFIKTVRVRFNGTEVLHAETDIAISEDPSFKFYFVPNEAGQVEVEVIDSKELKFTHTYQVQPL